MPNLPYVLTTGSMETMLDRIKSASVPDKFSQDFVTTKLLIKGGSGRALIPFIKKMGLVATDGTPTDRYKEFRNPDKSGIAIAESMREMYEPLFEMNEYVYELDTSTLKGLIVEATGSEPGSTVVAKTLSTFQALKKKASFEVQDEDTSTPRAEPEPTSQQPLSVPISYQTQQPQSTKEGINLSYTINLNLPPTTDIEVFNAIFKSLKQHLLQD